MAEVVDTYGNANFMLGEESEESHFSYFNDIDRLGSDVTILYIRPSKKYAKGGETTIPIQVIIDGDWDEPKFFKTMSLAKKYVMENTQKHDFEILDSYGDSIFVEKGSSKQDFDFLFSESKFAKGGKIGFEGLAKKVAKRYVGKKVSKEYQAEYGKTYDAKEAKEVGNKVAGKVYKQQVAKKKIVRKLQRKTK